MQCLLPKPIKDNRTDSKTRNTRTDNKTLKGTNSKILNTGKRIRINEALIIPATTRATPRVTTRARGRNRTERKRMNSTATRRNRSGRRTYVSN